MTGDDANPAGDHIPRRERPRLLLGIPARAETLDGPRQVRMLNLSQTGAMLELAKPEAIGSAFLYWLDFEAFGSIVWQNNVIAGFEFDRPISNDWLLSTRQRAPELDQIAILESRAAAAAWASGQLSQGTER